MSDEQRLAALAVHYHNEKLYVVKLRDALERIAKLATDDPGATIVTWEIGRIAQEVLTPENRPPNPLAHLYYEGIPFGHPFPEYMHLPMRPGDEYKDPHKGG